MGFYGNISNASKTNLTFDKIYSSKTDMDAKAKVDEVFVGRFVLVEYDDNTFPRRRGYLNPEDDTTLGLYKIYMDSTYQSPYFLQADAEDGYGLKEGDLVYTEEQGLFTYYVCNGNYDSNDKSALFELAVYSSSLVSDYIINYTKDKNNYPTEFTSGWDGTIWQKAIVNGEECYQMIASLNSIMPKFTIEAEPPSSDPIAPYIGWKSTNIDYSLRMPTNYGFRVKDAISEELSDETYTDLVENPETGELEEKTKYYDIFYNKEALDVENKLKRIYAENYNYISLAPTGSSGKLYDKENGEPPETANDIQELSIHLPTIGNIASELWDLMYGDKKIDGGYEDERNDIISWDSNEGIRFITKDKSTGEFGFIPSKVESIAGVINSTQDLMGRIIKSQTSLKDADLDHIYYRETPEEGEENFRPSFFMKIPSTELISFDDLNEQYNLAFADYKEYIGGKNPQFLTQYEPNKYYIAVGSGVEGKKNYLCEIGDKPTADANYYTLEKPEPPEEIKLIPWEPTLSTDDENIKPEDIISYFYREEDGTDIINNKPYYKYIKDTNALPDINKEYYKIEATRLTSLNFYNPEEYTDYLKDEEGNEILDENNQRIPIHKYSIDEETGQKLYTGYFYYDNENQQLIPVYTGSPFIEDEEYYLLRDYYFESNINEEGKNVNVYYINGEELRIDLLEGNVLYVVKLISFKDQEIYQLIENETIYERVKYIEDINPEGIYYTIEATLLNGYLEVEKEDIEEGEIPEENTEVVYTNFYIPDTYYYKTINNDYLLDRGKNLQSNVSYYRFNIEPEPEKDLVFYEPNKYYYYSKSKVAEGKDPDKLDNSLIMKTAEDPDVVVQKTVNGREYIYYLKRKSYVVSDDSNKLNRGMVWDVNGQPPEGVVLGALFNDIVEELKDKGHEVEKKYEWKELKGFSQDLNTINGLILQLNKMYRFDDELTRDISTVQGMFNTLRDYFVKFDTLTPGNLLAVNEYGQLDSRNLSELTLTEYEVGTEATEIKSGDSINSAFGKLEYKINVLNGDSSVEGSVANQIAEIVEVDGGAIDKLKEIASWIVDDEAGAAKIVADVATNAGDIILNTNNILAISERIDALESKTATWDMAEPNVQADWNAVDETADNFILNKPDLSNMVKLNTEFAYNYGDSTQMTIEGLFNHIAGLEARIYALENPTTE